MYAIIKSGSKQFKVQIGDTITTELLAGASGDAVEIKDVLMVSKDDASVVVGTPVVSGASVKGTILATGEDNKGDKIIIFKKNRRMGYHKKQGHRQRYTTIKINEINA